MSGHAGPQPASAPRPGYEIGGASPYDLPEGLIVLIDDSLLRFDTVYTAAGTPSSMVRVARDVLLSLVAGPVATISSEA